MQASVRSMNLTGEISAPRLFALAQKDLFITIDKTMIKSINFRFIMWPGGIVHAVGPGLSFDDLIVMSCL